eukprot:Gb_08533 [translate_table: standard]
MLSKSHIVRALDWPPFHSMKVHIFVNTMLLSSILLKLWMHLTSLKILTVADLDAAREIKILFCLGSRCRPFSSELFSLKNLLADHVTIVDARKVRDPAH